MIGADFQLTVLETRAGDTLSGLVTAQTASALRLKATSDPMVVPKADILKRETAEGLLMPAGLLECLGDRERFELLKFRGEN